MRTYILSRELDSIPRLMHPDDRVQQLHEAAEVARQSLVVKQYATLPAVMMWDEYPYMLLEYFELFLDLCEPLVPGKEVKNYRSMLDGLWQSFFPDAGVVSVSNYEVKNPLLTASDEMIESHRVNLMATRPEYYSHQWPGREDLSLEFITTWR